MNKFVCETDWPVVSTDKGKVRGIYYNGNYIFKGIPYAKAGRFKCPQRLIHGMASGMQHIMAT